MSQRNRFGSVRLTLVLVRKTLPLEIYSGECCTCDGYLDWETEARCNVLRFYDGNKDT